MKIQLIPEILSPVGSIEAFYSAIEGGANAVYLGGKDFGARAYANNFIQEELEELITYAHLFDVKVYYTLNTIVKDIEFKLLAQTLDSLYKLKLDGLIIQDLGVYQYIKENYEDFIIHCSTQMNIHSVHDAKLVKSMGFDRIVVSRECSLEDIKKIKDQVDIEIESFVHGALCYCYSGQCLMSSVYGGRSGNRGKCAQPCRLSYSIDDEEAYFLSPKDQMTLEVLPDLILAGVDSFKIEGRMKGKEYVYLATKLYKKYRDLAIKLIEEDKLDSYKISKEDLEMLNQLFNRGNFTQGYYKQHNSKAMISYNHSKNLGVYVGDVISLKPLTLKFDHLIDKDDLLEIHEKDSLKIHTFKLNKDASKGKVTLNGLYSPSQEKIKLNHLKSNKALKIYRVRDVKLLNSLEFSTKQQKPLSIHVRAHVGETLKYSIVDHSERRLNIEGNIVQKASKRPIEEKDFRKQLGKTKDTNFYFQTISFDIGDDIFIPIGAINALRRDILKQYSQVMADDYKASGKSLGSYQVEALNSKVNKLVKDKYSVLVTNLEQFNVVSQEVVKSKLKLNCIYIDITDINVQKLNIALNSFKNSKDLEKSKPDVYLGLPHVSFEDYNENLMKKINTIDIMNYQGFLVRTLGQINIANEKNKAFVTDYNMHTFNKYTTDTFNMLGATKITLSLELNKQGIRDLVKVSDLSEVVIYGKTALMHSANCLYKTRNNRCDYKDEGHELNMTDRKGMVQHVKCHCSQCYNTIYNQLPLYLFDEIQEDCFMRLDFITEDKNETKHILDILTNKEIPKFNSDVYTRGHFKRGVQ